MCVTHAVLCVVIHANTGTMVLLLLPLFLFSYFRYVVEPDVMDPDHTLVVEIPVR